MSKKLEAITEENWDKFIKERTLASQHQPSPNPGNKRVLDLCMYLRQEIEERSDRGERTTLD